MQHPQKHIQAHKQKEVLQNIDDQSHNKAQCDKGFHNIGKKFQTKYKEDGGKEAAQNHHIDHDPAQKGVFQPGKMQINRLHLRTPPIARRALSPVQNNIVTFALSIRKGKNGVRLGQRRTPSACQKSFLTS